MDGVFDYSLQLEKIYKPLFPSLIAVPCFTSINMESSE